MFNIYNELCFLLKGPDYVRCNGIGQRVIVVIVRALMASILSVVSLSFLLPQNIGKIN